MLNQQDQDPCVNSRLLSCGTITLSLTPSKSKALPEYSFARLKAKGLASCPLGLIGLFVLENPTAIMLILQLVLGKTLGEDSYKPLSTPQ